MNENVDVMISNYLTILSNPELSKNFDPSVIHMMQSAVAIYAAKTSLAYIEEEKKHQAAQSRVEEENKLFK